MAEPLASPRGGKRPEPLQSPKPGERATAVEKSTPRMKTTLEHAMLRLIAPKEGALKEGESLKEGYLKKVNSLTTAKVYCVLDQETLTWWDNQKLAGPRMEVEDKHRLLLNQVKAVVGTKNAQGDEFEITYAQGEGKKGGESRSVVLRAEKGEGRVWVRAILQAKEALGHYLDAAISTWQKKLNACQVPGCDAPKCIRGFCAQHYRLFFGEDPNVELARFEITSGEQSAGSGGDCAPALRKELRMTCLPRFVGKLGIELNDYNLITAFWAGSIAERAAAAVPGSLMVGDELVGANGYDLTGDTSGAPAITLAQILPLLPASSSLTLTVVRTTKQGGGEPLTLQEWFTHVKDEAELLVELPAGTPTSTAEAITVGRTWVHEQLPFSEATPEVSAAVYALPDAAALAVGGDLPDEHRPGGVRVLVGLPRIAHVAAAALGDAPEVTALVGRKAEAAGKHGELELNALLVQLPLWRVPEDSRVARLFKACHWEVLQPAIDQLREQLHPHLTLRPQPSTWEIHLRLLLHRGEVVVLHRLWSVGTAVALPDAPQIRFCWQLRLTLDQAMSAVLSSSVSVLEFTHNDADAAATKESLSEMLGELRTPWIKFRRIWSRPLQRLPVWKDLPRLMKGMRVTSVDLDGTETELYVNTPANGAAAEMQLLIPTLARNLDGEQAAAKLEPALRSYLGPSAPAAGGGGAAAAESSQKSDTAGALQRFLADTSVVDPDSGWARVLKCVQQEMVAPAVVALRESVYEEQKYRDVRGTWKISCVFMRDSVIVRHRKWEQTQDYDEKNFFKFQWQLELTFDREMRELLSATVAVIKLEFGPVTTLATIQRIRALLRPWLHSTFPYDDVWGSILLAFSSVPQDQQASLSDAVENLRATTKQELRATLQQASLSGFPSRALSFAPPGQLGGGGGAVSRSISLRPTHSRSTKIGSVSSGSEGEMMGGMMGGGVPGMTKQASGGRHTSDSIDRKASTEKGAAKLSDVAVVLEGIASERGSGGEAAGGGGAAAAAAGGGGLTRLTPLTDVSISADGDGAMAELAPGESEMSLSLEDGIESSMDPPPPPDARVWLRVEWSAPALRHQLLALGGELPDDDCGAGSGAAVPALAKALHALMEARDLAFEAVRQVAPGGAASREEQALQWVGCVLGVPLLGLSVHEALKTGEHLCDLVNALKPGLVSRVTRDEAMRDMSAAKCAAKQRENLARFLDSLAFLGLKPHDRFAVPDLHEARGLNAVLNTLVALGLHAGTLPGYHGPVLSHAPLAGAAPAAAPAAAAPAAARPSSAAPASASPVEVETSLAASSPEVLPLGGSSDGRDTSRESSARRTDARDSARGTGDDVSARMSSVFSDRGFKAEPTI